MKIKTAKFGYLASYTFLFAYHLVWLYLNFTIGGKKEFLSILTVPILPIGYYSLIFIFFEILALIYLAWYIVRVEYRDYDFHFSDIVFYMSIIFYAASVGFQVIYSAAHGANAYING